MYTKEYIANVLDLAVLKPTATYHDVDAACNLANKHGIQSVCVTPIYTRLAASQFHNVSTVIGFPHGHSLPDTKYREAISAIKDGARELDIVVNYGRFLDGDCVPMTTELALIVSATHSSGILVKAILETCYYTSQQLIEACHLCVDCGVDFIKTSTGFAEGASPWGIHLMIEAVNGKCQVKASGGIKTYSQVAYYLDAGCTRIGASDYFKLLP